MGNTSGRLRRPRRRKKSENASSIDKTHSSQTGSIHSDVQSDPGASESTSTQSEVQPDPQPSESTTTQSEVQPNPQPPESDWSVHIWYRHTGEAPLSDNWMRSAVKRKNAKKIREDIGEHHITHVSIRSRLPPSLKDIAPKLTHLQVNLLRDNSQLESLRELEELTELYLVYCELTDLPDNFKGLKKLEVLHVSHNPFSNGLPPSVIAKLTSLRKLCLGFCHLTGLLDEFGELQQLEKLDLVRNNFSDGLSDEITKLGSLTELKLDNCRLTDLPQRFGELQQLESLSLVENDFSSGLPDVITKLSSLTSLGLSDCSLTELPERFGELRQLEKLDLGRNNFSDGLSDEITKLGSLTELKLDRCRLTDLPQRFRELQQLESLSLTENDFSSGLPAVITKLSSLTNLSLSTCSLTELPERISNLKNLRDLDLMSNCFVKVPPAVFDLKELKYLGLRDNPSLSAIDEKVLQLKNLARLQCHRCPSLESPPYEVCLEGINAIRSYFVELAKGVEISAIPVAIVGNSLSGKSSIVRSLKKGKRELTYREKASPKDEITKVFNVEKLKFSKSHVRLIDHGGQGIYHIAYHLALKEQCVPLIVVNIFEFFKQCSSGDNEEATRDVCFDWLCHLYLACPNLGSPLLALTHTDKLSAAELQDSKDVLKKTVENIRRKWQEEDRCKDESQGKFKLIQHLSNLDEPIFREEDTFEFNDDTNITSNIQRLKENIGRRCEVLERKIPQSWEEVSAFLEKASDKPYMKLSAIEENFRDRDCKTILEYMHNTGKILWFQQKTNDGDNELYPYIFHQIPAITKVVSLLFHQSPEEMKSDREKNFMPFSYDGRIIGPAKDQELLQEFLSTGVLDEALLDNLLVNELQFDSKIAVKLLKCFHIVHGPVELKVSNTPRNVYTIPSFAIKQMDHSWETDGLLQLRLDIKFHGLPLPKYAYHIASVSPLKQAKQFNTVDARSNGVIVKHGGNATYLIHGLKARKVTLQVSSNIKNLSDSWLRLRNTAKDITDVISKRWKASRFEVIHYCTHCLFLRDADPKYTVDPDWFTESLTYDGLDLVACYQKGGDLTVPKPLMYPCSNLSSDEISSLDSYLKELQSSHACST